MPKFFGLRSNNGLDGPFGSAFGCLALRAAGAFAGLAYRFAISTSERKITSVQVHSSETKRRRASPRRRPSRASTPRARRPTPDAAHEIRPTRLARTLRPNAPHHHATQRSRAPRARDVRRPRLDPAHRAIETPSESPRHRPQPRPCVAHTRSRARPNDHARRASSPTRLSAPTHALARAPRAPHHRARARPHAKP